MDNFTLAVIFGAITVCVIFGLMFFFDKEREPQQQTAPPIAPAPKPIAVAKPSSPAKAGKKGRRVRGDNSDIMN
jgi:hypothetical protein